MKPLQAEEVQLKRFIASSRPLHIYKVAHFIMIKFSHKNISKSKQIFPMAGIFTSSDVWCWDDRASLAQFNLSLLKS